MTDSDHRNIKSRTNVMLGFKRFRTASVTLAGIALMHRIRKGQFNLAGLHFKDSTTPEVWNTVRSY
jgi:transposase-like protein